MDVSGTVRPLALWLVCWLAWPHSLIAQRAIPGDWTRVRSLPLNTSIVVKTKAHGTYHGELIDVTDTGLSLNSDERGFPGRASRRRDLRREDILKIRRFSKAGSAIAGAGLGAAAGVGIGLAIDLSARSNEDRGLATAVLGLLGTLLGWAVGRHSTLAKGETIYVAP